MASRARTRTTWGGVLVIGLALGLQYFDLLPQRDVAGPGAPAPSPTWGAAVERGSRIEQLIRERRSGVMVESAGVVVKSLRDDDEGSRHQRFLFETASGNTLLVAHNIDLARRVPLREGDRVRVFGQYEWNEKGGVLHWTHRDPEGRHAEGFIEHEGIRYE